MRDFSGIIGRLRCRDQVIRSVGTVAEHDNRASRTALMKLANGWSKVRLLMARPRHTNQVQLYRRHGWSRGMAFAAVFGHALLRLQF